MLISSKAFCLLPFAFCKGLFRDTSVTLIRRHSITESANLVAGLLTTPSSSPIKSSSFPPIKSPSGFSFLSHDFYLSNFKTCIMYHPVPLPALPLCLSFTFGILTAKLSTLLSNFACPGVFLIYSRVITMISITRAASPTSLLPELTMSISAFEAMKSWEDKCKREGHPNNHALAKEMLAGFVAGEVDKLIETKGLDFIDSQKAKHAATQQVHQYYDEEWVPNNFTGDKFTPTY
ncbi:hypothetical protein BC937DRAFT_90879 [Endogone sp. FLAS-F59071]|nr:hypothetical protein BC937DRAFT_90879 [Endogone sp. FLAS-F59071]|eukprot:RUS21964.1 hypothetical protein BC937DRAFT_90879 [Endogone sp. FLAS-F59071]